MMPQQNDYLAGSTGNTLEWIVKNIDRDVERGEDIIMFGFGVVMLSSTFAPIAPPVILLPLVALTFAISSGLARHNYLSMERKLNASLAELNWHDTAKLRPIAAVFAERPMPPLIDSLNPLKNLKRTLNSILGAVLINPLWMPILYMMGIQICEEKNLIFLNKAIIGVEQKLADAAMPVTKD